MSTQELTLRHQVHGLYVENQGWLQGWLKKKLGCSELAADLLHDTFIRILSREELVQAREPRAHLMTVAKRVLVDHWRREQIEKAYLEALKNLPEQTAISPEQQHTIRETLHEVDRLLDGLPVIVKRAFLYSQLDGMKQKEIAEKLSISLSTVKRYLVQAGVQCYFALKLEPK